MQDSNPCREAAAKSHRACALEDFVSASSYSSSLQAGIRSLFLRFEDHIIKLNIIILMAELSVIGIGVGIGIGM